MSRNVLPAALASAFLIQPLSAQGTAPVTAEEAIEETRNAYGPQPPEPECEEGEPGEIVVCARLEEQSQFRLRTDKQVEDDYARATMNKGDPKAPDVAGPGIFKGEPTVGSLCIPGLQKCPPPPAYFIDFSELPETPPGSDADRVGRGLAPKGNDEGDSPPSGSDGEVRTGRDEAAEPE